ncbi:MULTISPECIES: hypothetical protein [Clostridium]|uniref:hypothetical protein n=1 Tax=Clostridium TaxID=1485 RepID=UPI0008257602|nr:MULTISPECIES: hypothetical protein [Clostridium]PJI06914.1 hypothetical protein CUB90_03090 [Clostridium sp. CT7]
MDNPFIEKGFLSSNASINKLIIQKMPTDKITQKLEGKRTVDIFSTELFIREIKKNSNELKIDINDIQEKVLPQYLNKCLKSDDISVKKTANSIVKLFGERLAVILLTLKKGERVNRISRKDWNDTHWEYWNSLKNVILVGGLSSSELGKRLKYYVEEVFKKLNENCYNIILSEDSANAGIRGCLTYIKNPEKRKSYLIFDCGQTFIKRGLIWIDEKGIKNVIKLDKVLSKHTGWNFQYIKKEKSEAEALNSYILSVIIATIRGVKGGASNMGNDIVISIANYVKNGLFANRGGYGKLRLISDNYEEYLSYVLYQSLGKMFKVTLVHDGTAMAAAFSNYSNAVCLSLGTAFGVGFPVSEK